MILSTIKVEGNVVVKKGAVVDGDVVVGKGAVVDGDVKIASKVVSDGRYAPLPDKPQINFRTLESGNNTYEYLGIQEEIDDITNQDIDNIIYGG